MSQLQPRGTFPPDRCPKCDSPLILSDGTHGRWNCDSDMRDGWFIQATFCVLRTMTEPAFPLASGTTGVPIQHEGT